MENMNGDVKDNSEIEKCAMEAADSAGAAADVKKDGKKKMSNTMIWVRDILVAVLIAFLISQIIKPTIVQQHSMDNTLANNDYLIMYRLPFRFGASPDYGDIVVFKSSLETPDGKEKMLIKRVIAKGGDTVSIADGVVYRNGEPLFEPYTRDGFTNGGMDDTVVPDGELFLLGDNRVVSIDSRDPSVGFVPEDLIVGKAVFRLFPLNRMGGLYSNYPDGDTAAGEAAE